jgi:hypothetical protein
MQLNELGYQVIRFTNEEVFSNPEQVALKTKQKLDRLNDSENVQTMFTAPLKHKEIRNSPPSERLGEVNSNLVDKTPLNLPEGETLLPPLEGSGEVNSNLVDKTPLNLPQGETFVPALERQKEQNSPPSEGLGEVLKTQLF